MFVLSQIIGIVAVVLFLLSFQMKQRRQIVFVTAVSNGLYVLQYALLGAFTGAILDCLSTLYSFVVGKKSAPRFGKFVNGIAVFIMLLVVSTGVSMAIIRNSWIEVIPVVGTLLQTGGLWFNREQTIRKFALAGAPFWIVYNFISQAYGAALGSTLSVISVVVALVRYHKAETENT